MQFDGTLEGICGSAGKDVGAGGCAAERAGVMGISYKGLECATCRLQGRKGGSPLSGSIEIEG